MHRRVKSEMLHRSVVNGHGRGHEIGADFRKFDAEIVAHRVLADGIQTFNSWLRFPNHFAVF